MKLMMWAARVLAIVALLMALILAFSRDWGGMLYSLFLAAFVWVLADRFKTMANRPRKQTTDQK